MENARLRSIIDGVIAAAITLLLWFIPLIGLISALVGAAYILLRDGLEYKFMDHRSIGKKLMKLRPVRLDGGKVDIETSIKRNWMLVLGIVIPIVMTFISIPILLVSKALGNLVALVIGIVAVAALVIGIMEIVFVLKNPEGRRWGDQIANTKVIEVND